MQFESVRRIRQIAAVPIAAIACLALAAAAYAAEPGAPAKRQRHALLVGCTQYYYHPEHALDGPANDVVLMKKILDDRFEFNSIRILSEGPEAVGKPTRANIASEFQRLEQVASSGDQLLILLAGHGSQQPDQDRDPSIDPEPDGLDETFLPCDVKGWEEQNNTVTNAIIDDELGRWTRAIAAKGALVWIIFDSCHSGTALRGDSPFKLRRLDPSSLGAPEAKPVSPPDSPERTRGGDRPDPGDVVDGVGGDLPIIAMYAAQSFESEKECLLPLEGAQQQWRGLLSYSLCQILEQGPPPSYRELQQCILAQYRKWGWSEPTPLIEGPHLDRIVFDEKPRPARFQLTGNARDGWKIMAGRLHGLTVNSILGVSAPRSVERAANPGSANEADAVAGYVRVVSSELAEAVVEPCAYDGRPAVAELPPNGLCKLVYRDLGDMRVRVAVDRLGHENEPGLARLAEALANRQKQPDALFQLSPELRGAHWAVQLRDGEYWLLPADQATALGKLPGDVTRFRIPSPADDEQLAEALNRAARVHNLLALAEPIASAPSLGGPQEDFAVAFEMVRLRDKTDRQGTPLPGGRPVTLRPNDWVAWRIYNRGVSDAFVTLLFIDSHLAISPLFPSRNSVGQNRIPAGKEYLTRPARITATTTGHEQIVAIAVKAGSNDVPVDFLFLSQPSLDLAFATRGGGDDSPLARLLKTANYRVGHTRGAAMEDLSTYCVRFISWNVEDNQPAGP